MSIKASFLIELNLESEVEVLTYGSFLLNKLPIFAEWSKLIDLLPGLTPPWFFISKIRTKLFIIAFRLDGWEVSEEH